MVLGADVMGDNNTILVFPHIPKTGGTTLLYHFRTFFGDNRVLVVGPHGRVRNFFEDRPQFEELTPQQLAEIRLVQGHGVGEETLRVLIEAGQTPRLITVLRHPLSLTRSRYNHKANAVERRGGVALQSEAFLKQDHGNVMCRMLTSRFPCFVDPGCDDLASAGLSVLRKFNYVFATEQMDQQVAGMMQYLELPEQLERRRVATSKKQLEISDADLASRHRDDLQLFEQANQLIDSDGHSYNPVGFQSELQQQRMGGLAAANRAPSYEPLIQGLCTELLVEAALIKLEMHGAAVQVADPQLLQQGLKAQWEAFQTTLLATQKDISRRNAEAMRARLTRAALRG